METNSPGFCRRGGGSTGSGDHSGEMGMNGFRWSDAQAERGLREVWRHRETRKIFCLKHSGKE